MKKIPQKKGFSKMPMKMYKKTGVTPPKRVSYDSYCESVKDDPLGTEFLKVYDAEQDKAFQNRMRRFPKFDKTSGEPTETEISAGVLKKALSTLPLMKQDSAMCMMKAESLYWNRRYLNAFALHYEWSGWCSVLDEALKGTKYEKDMDVMFNMG